MGSYYQYKRMAPYYTDQNYSYPEKWEVFCPLAVLAVLTVLYVTDQNYSYPEKMEVFCPLAVLAGLTVLLLDDEEEEE